MSLVSVEKFVFTDDGKKIKLYKSRIGKAEIKIGSKVHDKLKNSTLISLTNGSSLKISSAKKSQFLIIAGKPIGEPIARGGPFVMNTKQEILKAVQDYHSGNFVQK